MLIVMVRHATHHLRVRANYYLTHCLPLVSPSATIFSQTFGQFSAPKYLQFNPRHYGNSQKNWIEPCKVGQDQREYKHFLG